MQRSVLLLSLAVLLGLPCPGFSASGVPLPVQQALAATAGFERLPAAADVMYRDPDPATEGAAEPAWMPGNPRHLRIARTRAQGPAATARDAVRHAYLLGLNGRREEALNALHLAAQRYGTNSTVLWSLGWMELHLGNFPAALASWQQAEALHGGQPYWVPYSKALALIGMGDNEAALAWWTVAQRSLSPHLDSPKSARRYFSYWRPLEKALLARLLAQGSAKGPALGH